MRSCAVPRLIGRNLTGSCYTQTAVQLTATVSYLKRRRTSRVRGNCAVKDLLLAPILPLRHTPLLCNRPILRFRKPRIVAGLGDGRGFDYCPTPSIPGIEIYVGGQKRSAQYAKERFTAIVFIFPLSWIPAAVGHFHACLRRAAASCWKVPVTSIPLLWHWIPCSEVLRFQVVIERCKWHLPPDIFVTIRFFMLHSCFNNVCLTPAWCRVTKGR